MDKNEFAAECSNVFKSKGNDIKNEYTKLWIDLINCMESNKHFKM